MSKEDDSKLPDRDLERAVSVAVVKADNSPAIDAVVGAVNVLATAIGIHNPEAGLVIQTTAVLGGWVWSKRKFDRVKPVLEEVQKRIQSIEHDYVRRAEFPDLLEDALRRLGDQPDLGRQEWLRRIVLKVIDNNKPKDHGENRLFLRLADEMSIQANKIVGILDDEITVPERQVTRDGMFAARASIPEDEVAESLGVLVREGLVNPDRLQGPDPSSAMDLPISLAPGGSQFESRSTYGNKSFGYMLTRLGRDYIAYRRG